MNAFRCNFNRHVSFLGHLFYRRLIGMQGACFYEGTTYSECLNFPTSCEYRKQTENKIYGNLLMMMMQFQGRSYSVYHANILFLFGSKDYHNPAVSQACLSSLNLLYFDIPRTYVTSNFFAILILYSHLCLDLQRDIYFMFNIPCIMDQFIKK
jgi:hypothetical protein